MANKKKEKKQKISNKITHPIDKFFGRLFLDKEIVKELLVYLVEEDFVKDLNFKTLSKVDRRGVEAYEKDKTTDVLWKVKYKNKYIHIGILIEVQSSNDNTMPIRFLDYVGLYYENHYQTLRKNSKIIPIIPILFYIGSENWNAKVKFHDLVRIPDENLRKYIPDFEYIPVILNNIDKEKLSKAESMLTRLLSLNKSENEEEFKKLAINIFDLIVTFTDKTRQERYTKHLLKYMEQVLGKKISDEARERIIEEIIEEKGGEMFFVTMEHLFEDDKKALEKERIKAEKERKKAEKERKKAEKERKSKEKAVLKYYKKGFSVEELADDFEMKVEEIKEIIENDK